MTTVLAALATTVVLGAAPAVVLTSPAHAANATPGCISKAEYRAVKRGTTLASLGLSSLRSAGPVLMN